MDRRRFLGSLAAAAAAPLWVPAHAAEPAGFSLAPGKARVSLLGPPYPDTDVWAFGARVPGPEIRVKQGETVRVAVANALEETTTVHWHGVRVPNAMDGVPHLTQEPIAAGGGTFTYEFVARDAGTFWYHPHSRSYEQVDRGLYGALVVEEETPLDVDRDVVWVLDDWRLRTDGSIAEDFLSPFDTSHGGRIGNTVTLNGRLAERFELRAGERLRLRLVNVANARVFGLQFTGHRPWIVALDGHPVAPHEPPRGTVVVGSGQRVDLVLDAAGAPGSRHTVRDVYYGRQAYRLLDLVYGEEAPLREARGTPAALAPNPLPEPELERAVRHEIRLTGGMGGMMMGGMGRGMGGMGMGGMGGGMGMGGMMGGAAWAINGVAITGESHLHEPAFAVKRGASVVLDFRNDTMWPHPMHLHGHTFRVVSRNGQPNAIREWRDTILLAARETARVAFVADNPGDWMLHCHILEHQAAGMMATFRVE